jgi:hypothetical protein
MFNDTQLKISVGYICLQIAPLPPGVHRSLSRSGAVFIESLGHNLELHSSFQAVPPSARVMSGQGFDTVMWTLAMDIEHFRSLQRAPILKYCGRCWMVSSFARCTG